MPVLVEGATWIARRRVLEERFRGGAEAFAALAGPGRSCGDGELVAVSFPDWNASLRRLHELPAMGLTLFRREAAGDVARVHQRFGPAEWCPWLELAEVPLRGGGRVLAARAAGSAATEVAFPDGWRFEGSASQLEGVADLPCTDRPLRFVRRDPDASVYLDRFRGTEVRVRATEAPRRLVVETRTGARHELVVEVVRRAREIALGLMHREHLQEDAGMLFVFGEDQQRSFWMKNTLIPLDMLFVSAAGAVVNVVERAAPMTLTSCPSRLPCSMVLEVNGGWAAARAVGVGDKVLPASPAARPGAMGPP